MKPVQFGVGGLERTWFSESVVAVDSVGSGGAGGVGSVQVCGSGLAGSVMVCSGVAGSVVGCSGAGVSSGSALLCTLLPCLLL